MKKIAGKVTDIDFFSRKSTLLTCPMLISIKRPVIDQGPVINQLLVIRYFPWITTEIRRKIRRKNATHAKAKKTGSAKFRSKFESSRKEIKADIRKQHDLYVNNLVGDVKANPRDFYRYINSQKKDTQGIPTLKKRNGSGIAQSELRGRKNLMVSSRMFSLKVNTNRSLLWIDLPHSCIILWSQRKG